MAIAYFQPERGTNTDSFPTILIFHDKFLEHQPLQVEQFRYSVAESPSQIPKPPVTPSFNFLQHWYPVAPLVDLDPQRPIPITLLGRRLVIWKPRQGDRYAVFEDCCPHRLAPLSEGRLDEASGELMCSYHGWQFDAEGHCTRIPQAERPEILTHNPKPFCVTSLPVQQAQDLLWVWPDAATRDLAAATPLPLSPQLAHADDIVCSSIVRDLMYDWQTLVENVADPSHVPFAHHGVQGNRERAVPVPIEILESTPEHIKAFAGGGRFQSHITFEPPCRLEYEIKLGENRTLGLVTYCIPTEPGRSRIVAQFPRNFAKALHHIIPRWWEHIKTRNSVLDGDMVLLHYQEQELQRQQQSQNWKTAYKMPTGADRLVIEFRRWLDTYGSDLFRETEFSAHQPARLTREALLDRYHQHTQICQSCSRALHRIKQIRRGLVGVAVVAIALAAVVSSVLWSWLLVGLALIGLGVYAGLTYWLEPRFYFVDYVHSDR